MDFIIKNIERRINLVNATGNKTDLRVYFQARLEYSLTLMLGYLWNKNFEKLNPGEREYIANNILRPSIGTIVDVSKKLDIENEFFGDKKVQKAIDEYPAVRNERLGHGFTFEDGNSDLLSALNRINTALSDSNNIVLGQSVDMIDVRIIEAGISKGIRYKADGSDYLPWSCPKEVQSFSDTGIYVFLGDKLGYLRVSPFILISDFEEYYVFGSIQDKLSGLTKYNRLLKTGTQLIQVPEFSNIIVEYDDKKWRSSNGTILNTFDKNYKKYINLETGIKRKIQKFLVNNKSSVFATVWGHGGVGKTAGIQSVCEDLANSASKKFDYIIFLSAKDRYYNVYKGSIDDISGGVDSLDSILINLNEIIFGNSSVETEGIVSFEGQILIVIDDFETFVAEEKGKILEFIKALNINHHKVIITTRSATLVIGEEIKSNELTEKEMTAFLLSVIEDEAPMINIESVERYLNTGNNQSKVYEITGGRPLFIFQFAVMLAQKGSLDEIIDIDIKSGDEAIKFLYDRIFDYLSLTAQHIFIAMSLLVDKNDLINVTDRVKYILSMEGNEEEFDKAINELVKLKIIEIIDGRFFRVYSKEILNIMNQYFQSDKGPDRQKLLARLGPVGKDRKLDTDHALLADADSYRITGSDDAVNNKYRHLINREHTIYSVKLQALLNLGAYLFNTKNDNEGALKLFSDYSHIFDKDANFVRAYALYLWSSDIEDSKDDAISLIRRFLHSKPEISHEMQIQLMSMFGAYQSIQIVNSREILKEEKRFEMISESVYQKEFQEQKKQLLAIIQYPGQQLLELLNKNELINLTSSTRTRALAGLLQLVEVFIRLKRYQEARDICFNVFHTLPQNFHAPFSKKIDKINTYQGFKKPRKSNEGDLASKLRDALGEN